MQSFTRLILANFFLSCFFSLLNLPTSLDLSILAFPLSVLFTLLVGYFSYRRLIKRNEFSLLPAITRMFQYEPFVFIAAFVIRRSGAFGLPFAIDLIGCLTWLALVGLTFVILHKMGGGRLAVINSEWAAYVEGLRKPPFSGSTTLKRLGIELLEWVDALVQAVFTIILLNIYLLFIFSCLIYLIRIIFTLFLILWENIQFLHLV